MLIDQLYLDNSLKLSSQVILYCIKLTITTVTITVLDSGILAPKICWYFGCPCVWFLTHKASLDIYSNGNAFAFTGFVFLVGPHVHHPSLPKRLQYLAQWVPSVFLGQVLSMVSCSYNSWILISAPP